MTDRSIAIRMRAEYQQAVAGIEKVGAAAEKTAQKIDRAGAAGDSGFARMAKHAKDNERAWTSAGQTFTVVGGAITALGAGVMYTGIQYNQLQQTSRAAMKTLMGGAQAANRQMDKLDEFARTSPFSKSVFIQAQQQLVGFGIEARKVIPYLSAIQNAVAAAGGGNQQLAELASIMSKIHATGKLTAQDLMEFGNRGVDAASLIGEAMGKTGAQIREDITAGAIGADEALDALAKGMEARFGGAAANVKQTLEGAADRVKAAWRDLSASLAEPLVGKNGGGLAVAGLNELADQLRRFENVPAPIRNTGLALAGLAGAGSLAAGGFLMFMPRLVETQEAFRTLAGQNGLIGSATRGLGKFGTGLRGIAAQAGAVAVLTGIAVQIGRIHEGRILDNLARSSKSVARGLSDIEKHAGALDTVFQLKNGAAITGQIDSLNDALDRTFNRDWETKTNDWFESWIGPLTGLKGESGFVADGFKAIDQELSNLVSNGQVEQAAKSFDAIRAQAEAQGISVERLKILFPEYAAAAQEAGIASAGAADGIGQLSPEAVAAQKQLGEVAESLTKGAQGFLDFASKAKDSKVSLNEWINDMKKQVEAQEKWFSNLGSLMDRGAPQEFVDFLMSLGKEGAFRVKQLADASDVELQRAIDQFNSGSSSVSNFANEVTSIPDIDLTADTTQLREQVEEGKKKLKELKNQPSNPVIDAKITLLEDKLEQAEKLLAETGKKKATATVDADTSPARKAANGFFDWFKRHSVIYTLIKAQTENKSEATKKAEREGAKSRASGGRYHGGIDVRPMQSGGMLSPIAQMVPPNTWRVVGDRLDVPEAFIPLDGSRRSWRILAETMQRMPGVMPLARGGIVSAAEGRVREAQSALTRARRAKTDAKTKTAKAAGEKRIRMAQDELAAAKRSLAAAKKRATEDERAAKLAEQKRREAQERAQRVGELQADLRTDLRRGSIRDQVTGGLSGAYSTVDRLAGLGKNQDLSGRSRARAASTSRRFEADLRGLYARADKLDAKLKDAKDKASELEGIQKSVTTSVLNARKLDMGEYQNFAGGKWTTYSGVAGAQRRMTADVGKLRSFANKLDKLRALGIPGVILQEIAEAGPDEGQSIADAFLGASAAERKSYLGTWSEYERQAGRIGTVVTGGFYRGGVNAAQGVVKGLESQKKTVEASIASLARQIEVTFRQVLGIHSPSTVTTELGEHTGGGVVEGILASIPSVQAAAQLLAQAATPALGSIPVSVEAAPVASAAMADMSDQTLTAMQTMRDAVAASMLDQQTNTTTAQQAMTTVTQTQQQTSTQAVGAEQQAQTTTVKTQQQAQALDMRTRQTEMLTGTKTSFQQMRITSAGELSSMRVTNSGTYQSMRADHSTHMDALKTVNRDGYRSMRDTGVSAFQALRSGMHGQMTEARPQLGNDLNRLIGVFGKFTTEVNKAFGDVGVKLTAPAPIKLATGGVLPGYTPGRDVHHFQSRTAGDLYLSGGESIMRPEFTTAVGGERGVYALNRLARAGKLDASLFMEHAFADGGVYLPGVNAFADSGVWRNLWAIHKAQFPGARLTSSYRPGSITASGNRSHHSQGNAIDVTPDMRAFQWWRNNYGANLAELIFSPANGQQIKNGRNYMYSGAVRAMHFNHIHIAALRALSGAVAAGLPGTADFGMPVSHPFLDRANVKPGADIAKSYREAAQKLTKSIIGKQMATLQGNAMLAQLGQGIMGQAADGLVKKAGEYGKTAGTTDFSNVASGPVKQMARQMLEAMGWGDQWGDLDWLVNKESSWNSNAQNPTSTAYGLFQFLNSTWGTVGGSKTSDPKKQIEYGLKYIKQRYGDVRGARRFWERNHWYESGTRHSRDGWAVVGEAGPELINLQPGHTIKNAAETRALLAQNRTIIGGVDTDMIRAMQVASARPPATPIVDHDLLAKAIAGEMARHPQVVQNIDSTGLTEQRIADIAVRKAQRARNLAAAGMVS